VTFELPCECRDNHGKHRWSEKNDPTLPPADASSIQAVTPSGIFNWQGPTEYLVPSSERIWSEQKWYALTGRVVELRAEEDGDLHIALTDASRAPLWLKYRQNRRGVGFAKLFLAGRRNSFRFAFGLGEIKAQSTTDCHRDRQGVFRHRPRSGRSWEPENRSSGLRGLGNSSGDGVARRSVVAAEMAFTGL
jgi:hypothetical protein